MSKNFAFIFPGQGSQHLGMLSELMAHYEFVKDIFTQASDLLGYNLWSLTQEGPEIILNQTEYTQPALLVAGVAVWRIWQTICDIKPSYLAGHSLGEYTALVCADSLDFATAVRLVRLRGQLMQEAVPADQGGMAAVIGLDERIITELCLQASRREEVAAPANYNSAEQIVVAGHAPAIDRLIVLAKKQGAKLTKKLPVSVPSHCILMKPAAKIFAQEFKVINFKSPQIPVVNNVDVKHYSSSDQIADALVRQLYHPVRWIGIIEFFLSQGVEIVIESGPGKVLTGLNKRMAADINAMAITQPDNLQEAVHLVEDFSFIGE